MLIYLACVALVGLPILVAEWLIGRRGQENPINAMADLARRNGRLPAWALVGASGVLAAFLILSFYSVIGGWSLSYTLSSVTGAFSGQDADAIGALFGGLLGSPVTLSLCMGIMMAYGSYLGEEVNLISTARTVIILDTAIALLAGMAIFPIVFANGMSPGEGPGLIFVSLPVAFGNMTGGTILGLMFFLLLTFAALTLAISLLEPVVELVEERTPLSRVTATLVGGVAVWALGIAALMSFNVWEGFLIFGLNIFDLLDTFTSKVLLPLTGLGAILFVAWCLERKSVADELNLGGGREQLWHLVARYVAPIGVIVVFVTGLL